MNATPGLPLFPFHWVFLPYFFGAENAEPIRYAGCHLRVEMLSFGADRRVSSTTVSRPSELENIRSPVQYEST